MTETIIKTATPTFHDTLVAKSYDCIVIAKYIDGHTTDAMVAIPLEDIPALIKALQPFANDVHERNSL